MKSCHDYRALFQIVLVGTKLDLKDDQRATELGIIECGEGYKPVSYSEGKKLANEIGALNYFETSAFTGEGIEETMNAVLTYLNGEPNCFAKFCCLSNSS